MMSRNRGYYSLIQYCPDPSRLEGVNVGVAVFSPEEAAVRVKIARDNTRIRRVFGTQNLDFINRSKEAIRDRLERERFSSPEELQQFIAKRANAVQLTPLRYVRIEDMESDLERLYSRLVAREAREKKPRIDTYLESKLIEAGVKDLVQRSVTVEIPNVGSPIRVPFGYQNGRFNLVSPVQFEANAEDLLTKAGKRAIEGQLLYKAPDPRLGSLQLVVVAKFSDDDDQASQKLVRRVFEEHEVKLHTFDNLRPLIDDIRHAASMHR